MEIKVGGAENWEGAEFMSLLFSEKVFFSESGGEEGKRA